MRETISGDTYDTEDATLVASHDCPSEATNPYRYWEEDLYRTADGRWFVHGRGGRFTLCSRFPLRAEQGEGILVLGRNDARLWLRYAGEVEAYKRYFSHDP